MKLICTCCFSFAVFMCGFRAVSETKAYAIVVGNNAPPDGTDLPTLKYADDDGVKYLRFFRLFSEKTYLLSVPDAMTQRRYAGIARFATLPTMENFEKAMREIGSQIKENRKQGNETIVYVAFSGHGAHDTSGKPFLAMLDGGISQKTLYENLKILNADFTHLFIDACYAAGVVGFRGMFENEKESRHVPLSAEQLEEGSKVNRMEVPGLGVLMATSADRRTHEWSQIESGIFTHEILSGLLGPADINGDGIIEYSELSAYVSVANTKVDDERGRISIVAKPPPRDQNVALVNISNFKDVSYLVGNPSSLGHFYIELENGERYLDANLGNMRTMHIAVPKQVRLFLSTGEKEATIALGQTRVFNIDRLHFAERRYTSRGSLEESLDRGLFQTEYGVSYYLGFIDSAGLSAVDFNVPKLSLKNELDASIEANLKWRKSLAIAAFTTAGLAAVAAGVLGGLALNAKSDLDSTQLMVASREAAERYDDFSTAFWITVPLVPVALLVAIIAMPKKKHKASLGNALENRATLILDKAQFLSIKIGF